ncbi:MAG: YihY/virulence factor BrkB family protein [Planctomycetota bacterium]|nr:YihY/virulence factor BrkB family protein [Planctomycetota bacterium]
MSRRPDKLSIAFMVGLFSGYCREVVTSVTLAARRWQSDDVGAMAAAVAYYLALSVFPILLLLSSGVGLFLKFTNLGHDAELQILSIVAEHCSPTLEQQVRVMLLQFEEQAIVGCPFGLITAIAAAIGVFLQFERAFDKIWRVRPARFTSTRHFLTRLVTKRFAAFLMLGSVGLAIIAIMVANLAISGIRAWMAEWYLAGTLILFVADTLTTILLNTVAFAVLYKCLPKKKVRWREAFRSALLVALTWELGRELLCSFLIGMRYTTTYGAVGSFIALLLWFYWGVNLLFFGAEYLQVLTQRSEQPFSMFDPNQAQDRNSRDSHQPRRSGASVPAMHLNGNWNASVHQNSHGFDA